MDIKRIIKEEIDDFNWIKESDPIEQLDNHYGNIFNHLPRQENIPETDYYKDAITLHELLNQLEGDYDDLFSSTLADICTWGLPIPSHEKYSSVPIIKKILCHDDFKKPEIKKLLKGYYKKRIKQLKKLLGQPSSTWETIKRYNPFYSRISDAIRTTNQNVNESDDFGWVDNSIEVGKCFMVNYPIPSYYTMEDINLLFQMIKIIDIKQGKELKGVGGRKLMDIPKDSFNERAVKIKFAKMNYGSWRDDFEIYYPEVQDWIDWGWLTPVECE